MYNFSNYSRQYNSCGNIGCNKCSTGPTGPGGNFQDGSCYGDYLYWDNNVNKWVVGGDQINIGCGA